MKIDFTSNEDQHCRIIRENKEAWRIQDGSLYVASLPGTLWGMDHNNVQNIILYPKPESTERMMFEVYIESEPENNTEQAGLIVYADDDHYIKLVKEMVDNKHVVVMAVEHAGSAAVHAKMPILTNCIGLRISTRGQTIYGAFKELGSNNWQHLAPVELPFVTNWEVGLMAHSGDPTTIRWGKFSDFSIVTL